MAPLIPPPIPAPIDPEALRAELVATRTRLETTEQARAQLQTRADELTVQMQKAQTDAARAQASAEGLQTRLDHLGTELTAARQSLAQAQDQLRGQEAELGRLRAIAEQLDPMKTERDSAQADLARLRADVERLVADAVRAAVALAAQEHQTALQQWTREREDLNARIADLEEHIGQPTPTRTTPADLASRLARVLNDLAEGHADPGKPYSAALTAFEVEARGLLQAPAEGEQQPRFVTVEPGSKVDGSQLSTLRMTFRLLPRIVQEQSGPGG